MERSLTIKVRSIPVDELTQGMDLGTYTKGQHDEWLFDPAEAVRHGCEPKFFSNTPSQGYGNTFYLTVHEFQNALSNTLIELAKGGDVLGDAFLYQDEYDTDAWLLIEILPEGVNEPVARVKLRVLPSTHGHARCVSSTDGAKTENG